MSILLYAPDLTGHPQVYCRVIARALLDAGHSVAIASAADEADWRSRWPTLRPLADEDRVRCVDVRKTTGSSGNLTAEQLVQVQKECGADSTLFIDADSFSAQFRRIANGEAPRLRGRICAIFSGASEWCTGEDPYTGEREPLIGPTLRRTLGRVKRALFARRKSVGYFYEHVLIRRRTVDALIVKDERIPQRFGPPVHWMPEIYRVFDVISGERRLADWDRFAEPIQRYIQQAGADHVLLYFGTGAWYKGYDWFLRLAQQVPGTFALHAGAPDRREGIPYGCDVEAVRQDLLRQGRLFETQAFMESGDLIELLFSSVARFVSTHRLTLSSGTALQALEMGKPVLTPDAGLVGWRTREFHLGTTYAYGDIDDLARKWAAFPCGSRDANPQAIRAFMKRFSREKTERFFVDVLTRSTT
jgi:glycosyltransferase involved in cell wall biosynthesis